MAGALVDAEFSSLAGEGISPELEFEIPGAWAWCNLLLLLHKETPLIDDGMWVFLGSGSVRSV